MKTLALAISLLLLSSCSGGDSISPETTVKASTVIDGAWNSNTIYDSVSSPLQDLVDLREEVKLPCGTYQGGVIEVVNNSVITGSGSCTIIPSIKTKSGARVYNVVIRDLTIDGTLDTYQNIGIDLRDCSRCRVENVSIKNVDYGILLFGAAYYNVLEDVWVRSNLTCFEIGGIANENIVRGGKCSIVDGTGTGLWLSSVNNNRTMNTAYEVVGTAILVGEGATNTMIMSPRCEQVSICIELDPNSKRTTILSPYTSSAGVRLKDNTNDYKDIGF